MEELWEELIKQNNVRENLSKLRMQLKELQNYAQTELFVQENEQTFFAFLSNEDAKTRKNAALLLGDLEYQNATPLLFASYEKEETLFVRGAYLQALGKLDATAYLPALETQLMRLTAQPVTEETKKHVDEEIRAIRKILIDYQGIEKHSFSMKEKNHQVLLTTGNWFVKQLEKRQRYIRLECLFTQTIWVNCFRFVLFGMFFLSRKKTALCRQTR